MKVDFRGWLRWVTGTALAMTVALVLLMPAITARSSTRSSTRDSAHISARRSFDSGDAKPEAQKTAGETFKNIEVLKDIPASELIPSMRYVAASLGVGCDYCHQADHFDNDDKPTKQRARNMMKMMVAINQDNFNGKREVTCYVPSRSREGGQHCVPFCNDEWRDDVGRGIWFQWQDNSCARGWRGGRCFERSSENDAEHNPDTGEIC
jgi:hypothetical protein